MWYYWYWNFSVLNVSYLVIPDTNFIDFFLADVPYRETMETAVWGYSNIASETRPGIPCDRWPLHTEPQIITALSQTLALCVSRWLIIGYSVYIACFICSGWNSKDIPNWLAKTECGSDFQCKFHWQQQQQLHDLINLVSQIKISQISCASHLQPSLHDYMTVMTW